MQEKFFARCLTQESGCIDWAGSSGDWYGQFKPGRGLKYVYAHRYAYELAYGPIPAKHDINHKCRNKRCVNPAHLEALTRADHMRADADVRVPAREASDSKKRGKKYSTKTSGYPCVFRDGRSWFGQFNVCGQTYRVGYFSDPALAHEAVLAMRAEVTGDGR